MNDRPSIQQEVAQPVFSGFPVDCPLAEAIPADGAAFRITKCNPPSPSDFLSKFEEGEEPKPNTSARARCRWRAISVYRTIQDARKHREKFPYFSGDSWIAAKVLTEDMGKTMLFPSKDGERPTHTSWWVSDSCDQTKRAEGFSVVD